MALFFYEQWTCSLKKCHGASFGNGLKEEVEKHVFFFLWMNIKTFRFKESVTFEKRKIKDMGELLAVAMSRGKCHWQKIRAVLASRLTASASGCSSLACRHKRQGGLRPSPCSSCPSEATRHREHCGDTYGTPWTAWIGRYYSSGTGLPVCHGFADCSDRK